MTLWILVPVLCGVCFGGAVWIAGVTSARPRGVVLSESAAWWRLVAPVLLGLLGVAFVVGWAWQEPDPADEWVTRELAVLAGVVASVILRAVVRAARSLHAAARSPGPVVTVGLVRCRTIVAPAFTEAATEAVLQATLAHERAHARARDPLRICVGQFVADLQWPLPRAAQRLRAWLLALELRRDDEALAAGASPLALAEGILLAARLHRGAVGGARVTGDGEGIAVRVRRLLATEPPRVSVTGASRAWAAAPAALLLAAIAGAHYGERLIELLPGVGR